MDPKMAFFSTRGAAPRPARAPALDPERGLGPSALAATKPSKNQFTHPAPTPDASSTDALVCSEISKNVSRNKPLCC